MWGYSEKVSTNEEVGSHQTLNLPETWSWDFPASRTIRNKCLLYISLSGYGILLQLTKWTKTVSYLIRSKILWGRYYYYFCFTDGMYKIQWLIQVHIRNRARTGTQVSDFKSRAISTSPQLRDKRTQKYIKTQPHVKRKSGMRNDFSFWSFSFLVLFQF